MVLWHGRRGEVPLIGDAVAHECGHAAPRDIPVRELGGPHGTTAYGALHCDPDDTRTLAVLDGLADRSARLDTLRAAWAASPNAHGPCGSSCPGETPCPRNGRSTARASRDHFLPEGDTGRARRRPATVLPPSVMPQVPPRPGAVPPTGTRATTGRLTPAAPA